MNITETLKAGQLDEGFKLYWEEMNRCRTSGTYWALLHVTVCLPDICAALQSLNGETNGKRYVTWCNVNLKDPMLSGRERWDMRCRVLHQGYATTKKTSRYTGFSFSQPTPTGETQHLNNDGGTLVLDVGRLAEEIKAGVGRWIGHLEADPKSPKAVNTAKHLGSLVRVRAFALPPTPGATSTTPPYFIARTS